jgi:hypothetical protein
VVLAGVAAVLVDFGDGQLHRGVVFGLDDAVGCRAFAGDVAIFLLLESGLGRGVLMAGLVVRFGGVGGEHVQVHELAAFVLHFEISCELVVVVGYVVLRF